MNTEVAPSALPTALVRILDRMAATSPPPDTAAAWRQYGRVKDIISRSVGWESPTGSSALYEQGIRHYCNKAGL